jgi:hypothetical protein
MIGRTKSKAFLGCALAGAWLGAVGCGVTARHEDGRAAPAGSEATASAADEEPDVAAAQDRFIAANVTGTADESLGATFNPVCGTRKVCTVEPQAYLGYAARLVRKGTALQFPVVFPHPFRDAQVRDLVVFIPPEMRAQFTRKTYPTSLFGLLKYIVDPKAPAGQRIRLVSYTY